MKVSDLRDVMFDYRDVAVSQCIRDALTSLREKKALHDGDELTHERLGLVLRELHQLPMDPSIIFLLLLPGADPNPKEASLQYIEKMMREL